MKLRNVAVPLLVVLALVVASILMFGPGFVTHL